MKLVGPKWKRSFRRDREKLEWMMQMLEWGTINNRRNRDLPILMWMILARMSLMVDPVQATMPVRAMGIVARL